MKRESLQPRQRVPRSKLGFTGSSVRIVIQVKAQRVEHTEKLQLRYRAKNLIKKNSNKYFGLNKNTTAFISVSVCNRCILFRPKYLLFNELLTVYLSWNFSVCLTLCAFTYINYYFHTFGVFGAGFNCCKSKLVISACY